MNRVIQKASWLNAQINTLFQNKYVRQFDNIAQIMGFSNNVKHDNDSTGPNTLHPVKNTVFKKLSKIFMASLFYANKLNLNGALTN
jgi:hypothetical protein